MIAMERYKTQQLFALREIGLALTFVGGFIDAYTFVQRGGVLAAGQTGNLIFLSVDIARQNLPGVVTKAMTVFAFMAGVMMVRLLENRLRPRSHYWRLVILGGVLVVCLVVGALPHGLANLFITPPLAFVMAMQTTAFGNIVGRGYNNVFSTGNLKKATSSLAAYVLTSDPEQLVTSRVYFELVGCFTGGAVVSALIQKWWQARTIWVAAGLVTVIGGYYAYLLYQRQKIS